MAATPPPGRTSKLASRSSVNRAQVHVRWDRVLVLFALVAVLAIVVVHSVVIVVRDYLRGDAAKPTPIEVGNPPANKAAECPRTATGAIRTAPAVPGEAAASQRTVALTFDDGPGASTPEVLGVLQKAGVHATFFVVGERAAAEPELLRRILADGHALGGHTWSHRIPSSSAGWNPRTLATEIKRTRRAVFDAAGLRPCLFRPPGGIVKGAERVTHTASLSMILWSVDTRDWSAPPNKKYGPVIRKRAAVGLTQQHPVILLHDGPGNRAATVAALEGIINDYRSRGYRFVTFAQSG
jgi:peptidoglycan-N-acetylglucosamine deacetylase